MLEYDVLLGARRLAPRVEIEALCSELDRDGERPGMIIDLSQTGVRLERPFTGGRTPETVQLEFELPGVDEIIWAKGEVSFDRVRRAPAGLTGLVRTTGIRLAAAAARDLRMLRDYVYELRRAKRAIDSVFATASCYMRG